MRTLIPFVAGLGLALTLLAGTASAEPARCTLTKIKDQDVSIDIPVDGKIGPEIFCQTRAQSVAKQYAVDHRVCDPKNAREGTFSIKVVWHVDKSDKVHDLKAYCPKLAARK